MNFAELREDIRAAALSRERRKLQSILRTHGWSVSAAATALEVRPSTIYRAVSRHPELKEELERKSPPPGRKPVR